MNFKHLFLSSLFAALCYFSVAQEVSLINNERDSVWAAVHKRWKAWSEVDVKGYINQHHPDWKRWGFSSAELLEVEDLKSFFNEWQQDERYVGFELSLENMELFGDSFCAVHYLVEARVEWVGDPFTAPSGERVLKGDQTTIHTRWSDFLVKEQGKWLYVGGYRDGNCAIWPGYGKPCKD